MGVNEFKRFICCVCDLLVDWYPQHVGIEQNGTTVTVTFNLAPQNLGIRSYFSVCYTEGTQKYTDITPVSLLQHSLLLFFVFIL